MSSIKGTAVAKIVKSFGLSGAVSLVTTTDIKERIYNTKEFYLDEDCTEKIFVDKIEGDWFHLHVFFKGYNNIDLVKNLIGKYLYLPRIDNFILKEKELFYYNIIEYKIEYMPNKFTFAKEIYTSNNMIYLSIVLDQKEYLVPFVDAFIEKIDKENHIIKLSRFELIEGNKIR